MSAPFRQRKSAMEVLGKLSRRAKAPISAMIEVADRCNETCLHCYQIQGQKGEMTTEQIFHLLDELAEKGVLFLTISGGEATLRGDFLEIVRYARAKKFSVKVYTNGLRVTREMAQTMGRLGVQEVQISLYSPRAAVHDEVTCVPGSFAKSTRAARWLVEAGIGVVLKTPLMKFNAGDHSRYIDLCESIGADYMFDSSLMSREDGDRTPLGMAMEHSDAREVLSDPRVLPPSLVAHQRSQEEAGHSVHQSVCGAATGSIHIEANGELRPCAALSVGVGNVLGQGLDGALQGTDESRFIASLTWAELHGCRHCELRAYCTRCYETARSEGDALGPYPSACARALERWGMAHDEVPVVVGSSPKVGPYVLSAEGFRVAAYSLTEEDQRRRREHPWITERATSVAPAKELVQIRRSEGGDTLRQPAAALDA